MARGSLVQRIVHLTPTPILVNPERVVIKSVVAVCGLTSLVAVEPNSLGALLPRWAVVVWGATWLLGGVCGLLGYWMPRRYLERTGHWLIIAGAVEYAISVAAVIGARGYVSILLVLFVAFCSAMRLLVAASARRSRRRMPR